MTLTVKKIAAQINATVIGDPSRAVYGFNSFEEADDGEITFASDSGFIRRIKECRAAAIIVPESFQPEPEAESAHVLLLTREPKRSFFDLVAQYHPQPAIYPGVHASAVLGEDIFIGENTSVGPGVVIGDRVRIGAHVNIMANVVIGSDSTIGAHTLLKPNITIMERSVIGAHVLIHSGTVIGSDGYGFTQSTKEHKKIIHTGAVHIGDHAEIGACNTIDRGTLGKTVIGNGVKTDNQVHIAHNVKIGDNCLIVAQVGIAGSSKLGKNVIVAGKAGISGHLKIGDNTIIGPYAGVHSNVGPNEIVSGIPHMPHEKWRKVVNIVSRLPEMRKKLFSLEKRIKNLEIDK